MREGMTLDEPISAEMPAHVWVALMAAYNDCDWSNGVMQTLLGMVQEKLFDPIWLKEKQAEMQAELEQHQVQFHSGFSGLFGGMPTEPPPDNDPRHDPPPKPEDEQ
jgi:hypothetical protein